MRDALSRRNGDGAPEPLPPPPGPPPAPDSPIPPRPPPDAPGGDPSRPPPRPSRPTPSKPPLNNLPGRAGAGTCPNLLQRRSAARSAARRSAEYQRSFSGAPARFGSLQQIWTTCRRGSSGEGGHGADDDHDGRTDGRTGPARTRPGLAGCKEPGCKEPCQSLGRVGRRLAPARSRLKLVRPARPMRLGWARFIPCGARPGQEMALWEDRSAPHSTMLPSEPRNHA